ncbi:MAG: GNAT family N-acetyltransferase [Anaerolineae bacterium]|nr:GNAT family N-acetyltransferase [Anaerolineae bacterium]
MKLITRRLVLREFQEDDWPAVLAYQTDPRYLRYYAWTDRTEEEVRAFVQMFLDQQRARPRLKFQLAITLQSTGALIGNCGIRTEATNAYEGDIGYELAPDHWRQGYATEAARAIVDFGFTELGLHRIWAQCLADNAGSVRVLEKLGLQCEGHLRENAYFKGRWWDTLLYGILDREWRARPHAAPAHTIHPGDSNNHGNLLP